MRPALAFRRRSPVVRRNALYCRARLRAVRTYQQRACAARRTDRLSDRFWTMLGVTTSNPWKTLGEPWAVLNRSSTAGVSSVTPAPVHVHSIPWSPGTPTDWPGWVPPAVRDALRSSGIERPWAHQALAAGLAHRGSDL